MASCSDTEAHGQIYLYLNIVREVWHSVGWTWMFFCENSRVKKAQGISGRKCLAAPRTIKRENMHLFTLSKQRSITCLTWCTEHERHQRERIGRYEHTSSARNHHHPVKPRRQTVKWGQFRPQSSSHLIMSNRRVSYLLPDSFWENTWLTASSTVHFSSKPIWTYGIQLWGVASASNIQTLDRFQSKALRMTVDAPWYVPNTAIRSDLQIPTVKEEIRRYSSQYSARLSAHPNSLIVNRIELPDNRRLRRHLSNDLLTRFLV
jgi:hypothetical protein